jgi:hypothetical protein
LKRIVSIFALALFILAILTPYAPGAKIASAQDSGYTIENIDHQIEVMYSGQVVIRDTVTVNGQISDGFLIGFPYTYGSQILEGTAFSSEEILPLSLGVPLGEVSGFYGAEVTFPTASPKTFTVVFVMSNALLTSYSQGYYLDFPAYPSLALNTALCSVKIALPEEASILSVKKDDGDINSGDFEKTNLPAFSYFPANATIEIPQGYIRQLDIATLNRMTTLGKAGQIAVSDSYRITNNSTELVASLKLDLPIDASNIVSKDELGAPFPTATLSTDDSTDTTAINITLTRPLRSGQSVSLRVEYNLPSAEIEQTHFTLNLEIYPYFSYYIRKATITVVPPEGARILAPSLSSIAPYSTIDRQLFQETLRFDRDGLSYIDHELQTEKVTQVAYEYNSIWASLRPAIWVWGLAAVGSVVLVFVRRPKASKTAKPSKIQVPKITGGRVSSDQVKTFVDAYEEKARISSELTVLSQRAQKGKMPRRQYKVQKKALQLRSASLSKTITDLKPTFTAAGGNYADLMKQLEVAETEINTAETNLRVAEARHKTGELSIEEYKKSISDLQKRKEKAESKISGILLRLREETR